MLVRVVAGNVAGCVVSDVMLNICNYCNMSIVRITDGHAFDFQSLLSS